MLMSANRQQNGEKRMLSLKRLIHQLPPHHYETLRFLAKHLQVVASNSSRNKMDISNLAIVFGPTLIRGRFQAQGSISGPSGPCTSAAGGSSEANTASMNELVKDTSDQCRIVQTIIKHVDWFFAGWEADSQVPEDDSSSEQPKTSTSQQTPPSTQSIAVPSTPADTTTVSHEHIRSSLPNTSSVEMAAVSTTTTDSASANRMFRRRSDNLQTYTEVSPRTRLVSVPMVKSRYSDIPHQEYAMSTKITEEDSEHVGDSTVTSANPVSTAAQDQSKGPADGFYSATLTYAVPPNQQQQPPTPPTSSRLHPTRRQPPTLEPGMEDSNLSSFLVRSLSLDSVEVFNGNNPPRIPDAKEKVMLPKPEQLQPGPSEDSESPIERLTRLEQCLGQLAVAEDQTIREAQRFSNERQKLQQEYEQLRGKVASDLSSGQTQNRLSQARF